LFIFPPQEVSEEISVTVAEKYRCRRVGKTDADIRVRPQSASVTQRLRNFVITVTQQIDNDDKFVF